MKSNYGNYIEERLGKFIVENEKGFATYLYENDYVYIEDIYVNPKHRVKGVASKFADTIAAEAVNKGYSRMIGSVAVNANNPTASAKVLLAYGFKILNVEGKMIYFEKKIGV